MRADSWLLKATAHLAAAGIATARLDALVLLEDALGTDRAWILADPKKEVSTAQAAKLKKLLTRRAKHEPLAYVRGHTEFYGRDFVITPAVLEPRPESEMMIDLLADLSATGDLVMKPPRAGKNDDCELRIADVGAGSGALGISAKLEFPKGIKVALDLLEIDQDALEVAKMNVDKYTMDARVLASDLLAGSTQTYDVLLCNLPYVPDGHPINPAASHEPKIALFGGPDGLNIYRRLFKQVSQLAVQPLFILTESFPEQHRDLETIAGLAGYRVVRSQDFIQVFTLS